jgi:transposase/copper chaperone CopZ
METYVFRVANMHCDDCATLITDTLLAVPGIHTATATTRTREVRVALAPDHPGREAVADAITELGFQLKAPAPDPPTPSPAGQQVSDEAWALMAPVLGNPADRDRMLVEGIAYKHRADARWREVPPEFGPWQTLYARWSRWRADGTWTRLTTATQNRPDLTDELDWLKSAGA